LRNKQLLSGTIALALVVAAAVFGVSSVAGAFAGGALLAVVWLVATVVGGALLGLLSLLPQRTDDAPAEIVGALPAAGDVV
jgi:hypothetical protein